MTKAKFIQTLSGFIIPELTDALAEQAESKGYFDNERPADTYAELKKKIAYAKASFDRYLMYEAKGAIDMSRKLGAITKNQYFELDHKCVAEGINNPKYF